MWVVGGDGDMLSIGGNHLIHALRRNVNLNILLFNNQIYGLTKGQYSPTSELGKVTKSTPMGSIDATLQPDLVSRWAPRRRSWPAPTTWTASTCMEVLPTRPTNTRGAAFVEIYQNCNVFNDGAFGDVTAKGNRDAMVIRLEHGEPIRFGPDGERGVVVDRDGARIVEVADVGEDALAVHDEAAPEPSVAFALARLSRGPDGPTPFGVLRAVDRPEYSASVQDQLVDAQGRSGPGDLGALLRSGGTWDVT